MDIYDTDIDPIRNKIMITSCLDDNTKFIYIIHSHTTQSIY